MTVGVLWLFLAMLWISLLVCVILAFPVHSHLNFHIVFFHNKIKSEVHMDVCNRLNKQTTLSVQKGGVRVSITLLKCIRNVNLWRPK